jgi:hypothetical protein
VKGSFEKAERYQDKSNVGPLVNTRATYCAHERYWNTGIGNVGGLEGLYWLPSIIPLDDGSWFCRPEG